jgi:hypothetical protein
MMEERGEKFLELWTLLSKDAHAHTLPGDDLAIFP